MNPIAMVVDYDPDRIEEAGTILEDLGYSVVTSTNRMEAIGLYWAHYIREELPTAVICPWLLEPVSSRSFYSTIGREIDHTSLGFFKQVHRLDPQAVCICHTYHPGETSFELDAEGLLSVIVADLNSVPLSMVIRRVQRGINRNELERAVIDEVLQSKCTEIDSDTYDELLVRYRTPELRLSR
jgi:CheY-like chemotaxis protein